MANYKNFVSISMDLVRDDDDVEDDGEDDNASMEHCYRKRHQLLESGSDSNRANSNDWSAIMEHDELSRINMHSRMSLLDKSIAQNLQLFSGNRLLQQQDIQKQIMGGRESVLLSSRRMTGRDTRSDILLSHLNTTAYFPEISRGLFMSGQQSFSCPNMLRTWAFN